MVQTSPQRYHPSTKVIARSQGAHLASSSSCGHRLARRVDGKCVVPKVSKDVYLFKAPRHQTPIIKPPKYIPRPKVHYNFVFVKTPDAVAGPKPVIVPPPKQKTLVYLLSQKPSAVDQDIIEVPHQPSPPEVFFVQYEDGDNTLLPGGIDLQTALGQSAGAGVKTNDVSSGIGNNVGFIGSSLVGDLNAAFASGFGEDFGAGFSNSGFGDSRGYLGSGVSGGFGSGFSRSKLSSKRSSKG
ncbi:Cuticle Protein Tweedle [Hyalella azteca]|nr:Cuticle Protein Tweedle [Hyalella azteca]